MPDGWNRIWPGAEWLLFIRAGILLVIARLGLRWLPFATVQRLLDRVARLGVGRSASRPPVAGICRAVTAASRFVPRPTCLLRAMAARALLVEHGYSAEVRLGVARPEKGSFLAHAWLESDGAIVMGGETSRRFVRLCGPAEAA